MKKSARKMTEEERFCLIGAFISNELPDGTRVDETPEEVLFSFYENDYTAEIRDKEFFVSDGGVTFAYPLKNFPRKFNIPEEVREFVVEHSDCNIDKFAPTEVVEVLVEEIIPVLDFDEIEDLAYIFDEIGALTLV